MYAVAGARVCYCLSLRDGPEHGQLQSQHPIPETLLHRGRGGADIAGWITYDGAGHICVCVRKLGVKYMHACVRAFAHMGLLLCGVAMQEAGLSGAVALFVQDLDS